MTPSAEPGRELEQVTELLPQMVADLNAWPEDSSANAKARNLIAIRWIGNNSLSIARLCAARLAAGTRAQALEESLRQSNKALTAYASTLHVQAWMAVTPGAREAKETEGYAVEALIQSNRAALSSGTQEQK